MTMARSNFPDSLNVSFKAIIMEKYKAYPKLYESIYNILKDDRASVKKSSISGLGNFVEKDLGGAVTYDDALQGYDLELTHKTYALAVRIQQELIEDDQFGNIKRIPELFSKSANNFVEQTAANILNYGFVTTYNAGGDAKALFATDHPLTGGGTYSNKASSGSSLSVTSLQAALLNMRATVDDRSKLVNIMPRLVVVPPALEFRANELIQSDKLADTANNNYNSFNPYALKVLVNPFLTSTTAWFLFADKSDHQLEFYWRKPLDSEPGNDFDNGDLKYKARMRFVLGFFDWRGMYGNAGA